MSTAGQQQIRRSLVRTYTLEILELLHAHAPPVEDRIGRASYFFAIGNAYGMLMAASGYARDENVVHPVWLGYDMTVEMRDRLTPEDIARSRDILNAARAARDGDSNES